MLWIGHRGKGLRTAALLSAGLCLTAIAQSPSPGNFETLLKQGFELHQRAQFTEAIPLLERALRLEPGDYFANLLLGIDLLRTGKAYNSLPYLHLAARTRPSEEIPEDYLGEANATLGRYAPAAEAYQQALDRGHDSEQAQEAWAGFALERFRQIGENLRATEAGIATVRKLMAAATKPSTSLICQGSITSLERTLAHDMSSLRAKEEMETSYKLSICYAVEAGRAASQLQNGMDNTAELHRLRGDVLLRLKGDPVSAEQEYRQAITLRPGDPALKERLAEAQFTAGDTQGAQQSALAALAIDPHGQEALRTLASLAMNNRDYQQALPLLRQLDAEASGDRSVQVQMAKALEQTGNTAEALQHLAPALAAGYPDEKGALHALEARLLRELGRNSDAAKAAAEARRLSDAFQDNMKEGAGGSRDENQ